MPVYMMTLVTSGESAGVPSWCASAVSGSSTGRVAALAPGAVAHSPVNVTSPNPSADSDTAGSGRASGLDLSARMSTPIIASTRPPGIGGSASFVATAALESCGVMTSCALAAVPRITTSPRAMCPAHPRG